MLERHIRILELLTENKKMEVSQLSKCIEVSQVTIRKDLDFLCSQGMVKREHGYALLNAEDDINSRLAYHYEIKQDLAEKALEIIEDHETIMIESGSCCALLAKAIAEKKKGVTIITNSAFIASYIRSDHNHKIILLGGEYQKESQVMVGPMVKECAKYFLVDKLFVGTDGYTENTGFTGNDYSRACAVRDMVQQAEKVIVMSESSKFARKGKVSLLPANEVYAVITDDKIPEIEEQSLMNQNVKIIKVKS